MTPGSRVKIVCILSVQNREGYGGNSANVNSFFLHVIGMQSEEKSVKSAVCGFAMPNISQEDEERIINLSKDP